VRLEAFAGVPRGFGGIGTETEEGALAAYRCEDSEKNDEFSQHAVGYRRVVVVFWGG
jgi:hypothetical protein